MYSNIMAGVPLEIDKNIRLQVEAILAEHGLIENKMTRAEAERELLAMLDKSEKSGICPLSGKEFWAQFGL